MTGRMYNGCPDSDMQARMDYEELLMNKLKRLQPDLCITYFPAPGYYQCWDMSHIRPLVGWDKEEQSRFDTRLQAILHAIEYIRSDNEIL